MKRMVALAVLLGALGGCAGTSLPYRPDPQPSGARISAAYQLTGDRLRIEIDTDGRRLEEARILRTDGVEIQPLAIDNPPVVSSGPPVGVGVGVGGGSFGGRGGIGVGTGVSVGIPVGGGSSSVAGNTFAWFALDQAGPAPWQVSVRLAGLAPVVILVGGPILR
ncbi:MAG TPA: hypothetical protein VF136_16280 [Methylomirabilota bacterium]